LNVSKLVQDVSLRLLGDCAITNCNNVADLIETGHAALEIQVER